MDKDQKLIINISSVLFLIGVCMLAYFLPMYIEARSSTFWPTTTGEILEMEHHDTIGAGGSYYEMTFTYTVDGKRHSASDTGSPFHKGETATVYYNPDEPSTAVLFPGATGGHYIAVGIGSFLALIGAYLFVAAVLGKVKVIR